jgi:GT2 family glycosyltransferase
MQSTKRLNDRFDLYVIIVNWNTKDLVEQCLDSIFSAVTNISLKVIVVDNASTDDSTDMIKRKYSNVVLIENKKNVGFAKANNQAFELIKNGSYVLMLNSDTLLEKDTLQKMVDFMGENPEAGAVAPALRFPDGKYQPGGGFSPSIKTALNYFLFLSAISPGLFKGVFVNQRKKKQMMDPMEVDWVGGTCMLIRKEVIDKTGGLDESYFMYAEDMEWCERIKRLGWRIYYLPYLEIIHYHGASSGKISNRWIKSLIFYIKNKKGYLRSLIFRLIMAIGLASRSIFYFFAYIITLKKMWLTKTTQMIIYLKGTLS